MTTSHKWFTLVTVATNWFLFRGIMLASLQLCVEAT